ncbi:MAG: hypothetical protein IH621_07390, partial [Krumholzibacteria bacterium]|nr:hypothetical protein [Candidatus Krumholzibacteria bacterium]
MAAAILVVLGLIALLVATFIMMLVTRSDLGALRREVEALRLRLRALERDAAGTPAAAAPA